VSNVRDMFDMFKNAIIFNQPLSGWERTTIGNVSSLSGVTNMTQMFYGATAFDQPIGNWNISNVANFSLFMALKTSATFSTTNLNAIYNGWSSLPIPPGVIPNLTNVSFGSAKYTALGQTGKDILGGPTGGGTYNWTIQDGGI